MKTTVLVIALATVATAHATPDRYRADITREANFRFGIPSPAPVIAAQIRQESNFNPLARSPVGAQGLMQFMPSTAAWASVANSWGPPDPFNPAWSIRAGVWYDRWLYDRIKTFATDCDRWHYTLSAYNGGLGWVYKRQKLSLEPSLSDLTLPINPGIHPANQHENQTYSPRILYKHQVHFASWGRTVCLR